MKCKIMMMLGWNGKAATSDSEVRQVRVGSQCRVKGISTHAAGFLAILQLTEPLFSSVLSSVTLS
jgi:hypothetical protein